MVHCTLSQRVFNDSFHDLGEDQPGLLGCGYITTFRGNAGIAIDLKMYGLRFLSTLKSTLT